MGPDVYCIQFDDTATTAQPVVDFVRYFEQLVWAHYGRLPVASPQPEAKIAKDQHEAYELP